VGPVFDRPSVWISRRVEGPSYAVLTSLQGSLSKRARMVGAQLPDEPFLVRFVRNDSPYLRLTQLQLRSDLVMGQRRMRLPVAAKIALQIAGGTTG
jgi:hypothetical protein